MARSIQPMVCRAVGQASPNVPIAEKRSAKNAESNVAGILGAIGATTTM
jgi:hypothetical protein